MVNEDLRDAALNALGLATRDLASTPGPRQEGKPPFEIHVAELESNSFYLAAVMLMK